MSQSDSVIDSLNYCTLVAIQTQTVCTTIQSELQLRGGGQRGVPESRPLHGTCVRPPSVLQVVGFIKYIFVHTSAMSKSDSVIDSLNFALVAIQTQSG